MKIVQNKDPNDPFSPVVIEASIQDYEGLVAELQKTQEPKVLDEAVEVPAAPEDSLQAELNRRLTEQVYYTRPMLRAELSKWIRIREKQKEREFKAAHAPTNEPLRESTRSKRKPKK